MRKHKRGARGKGRGVLRTTFQAPIAKRHGGKRSKR